MKVQQDVGMTKKNKSVLAYCLILLKRDKLVIRILQEAGHLFGSITKDIDPESKHWTIKSNTTSKEK